MSAVSADEVRAFYERHPYPPPVHDLVGYRERWASPERRRAAFHLLWPAERYRDDLEILIAGCGSSQAAKHALREPNARVIGIDISETSLEHTRELQRKYGIDNLELEQLPLERVEELGRRFDKIVCTGVLHHLHDPDAGLRALRSVLAGGGALHAMVYAAYGRTGIYMFQEYCRLLGVRATEGDLKELGEALGAVPPAHPIGRLLNEARDFRTPPAMADALLHPQDRAYTVPEVYDWLRRCGFSFGRWTLQAPYLPQCGAIAATPHAQRIWALPEPEQHAALELFRGTMVKHEFVAYRDDGPHEPRPIGFDGNRWLEYVPVRQAGTLRVTERLPEGAAAVLLNRAHTHTDIFLPIGPLEDGLFQAIDGERSVAEILQTVTVGGAVPASTASEGAEDNADRRQRARRLFERLWQFDQVVFQAPR
jgi:SAM-dependent methyltransferase